MESNQTAVVNVGMAEALKNISDILKTGLFAGINAQAVAAAIQWCDNGVAFYAVKNPSPGPDNQPAPKPDLKAVPADAPAPEAPNEPA